MINQFTKSKIATICILIFSVVGCMNDAPRFNPNDMTGLAPTQVTVSGQVTKLSNNEVLPNTTITLKAHFSAGSFSTTTDEFGEFTLIGEYAAGEYNVHCQLDGYADDSLTISIVSGQTFTADFALNGLPSITGISLTTAQEADFIPPNEFFVDAAVTAEDLDGSGDIELVRCMMEPLGLLDTLLWAPEQNEYIVRMDKADFGVATLDALFGMPIIFMVTDKAGTTTMSAPQYLTRVIDTTPTTISPIDNTTMPLQFQWENADRDSSGLDLIPYDFTYRIEIYLNSHIFFPPEDVLDGIPSGITLLDYANSVLNTDVEYYWVLYMVDELGNTSRSIQTRFVITE